MNEETYFENVRSYKLLAKKEVGQNFLGEPAYAKKIVDLLEAEENEWQNTSANNHHHENATSSRLFKLFLVPWPGQKRPYRHR